MEKVDHGRPVLSGASSSWGWTSERPWLAKTPSSLKTCHCLCNSNLLLVTSRLSLSLSSLRASSMTLVWPKPEKALTAKVCRLPRTACAGTSGQEANWATSRSTAPWKVDLC
eukprot:2191282-Lingulodinium_polyedra.AAC.2